MTFHKLCKKCKMFIKIVYCFLCFADMLIYLGLFGVCSLLDIELNLKKTRQKQHLYWEHWTTCTVPTKRYYTYCKAAQYFGFSKQSQLNITLKKFNYHDILGWKMEFDPRKEQADLLAQSSVEAVRLPEDGWGGGGDTWNLKLGNLVHKARENQLAGYTVSDF